MEIFAVNTSISNNPRDVVVNETVLLNYLQYQSKAFNLTAAKAYLEELNTGDKEKLVIDYVRDEVLYREALSMGLDENDDVIKRRLIQKLDYVNRGFTAENAKISGKELEKFFSDNINDYRVEGYITFTHVFFDGRKHGASGALKLALETIEKLNSNNEIFDNASRYGDRFYFHRNYVERTPEFIKNHFGDRMATEVFKLSPSTKNWHGPFVSRYGSHLVMVTKNLPARLPKIDEVKGLVEEDARRVLLDSARKRAIKKLISQYNVQRESSLGEVL
ncbi:MAG: peptidyl-prolyl cis-trans isomerase [Desulfobacteraceae bacterium]|nr:peptidyl-prolyl cis-trans isomerase [Desulfobacteraceae bacterium]